MKTLKDKKLKVRGIMLDLDGTIVDSKKAYLEALKAAFNAVGEETFNSKMAIEIPKRLEQRLPINDMIKGADSQKFLEVYLKTYYAVPLLKTELLPQISETLKDLSQKAELALVTQRRVPKEKVIEELENLGLAKYFKTVVTGLDTDHPKPSPDAVIKCAEKMNVPLCECAIIGDSVVDIKAGKLAGAKTVAVLSGIYTRKELEPEKPDLIIENINEFPKFLDT
ncbi:HAD family hydrolase [Candidatus Bathyarchaeota archaeon]|nr:HAD family hydrolase [Candidatus Bathyarchaeota archaeon]